MIQPNEAHLLAFMARHKGKIYHYVSPLMPKLLEPNSPFVSSLCGHLKGPIDSLLSAERRLYYYYYANPRGVHMPIEGFVLAPDKVLCKLCELKAEKSGIKPPRAIGLKFFQNELDEGLFS